MTVTISRFREAWPLWSVEKRIYGEQVWVELDDVPDVRTKRDGLHRLAEELRRLEHALMHDGIHGWIASVELGNKSMNRLLKMIGALPYAADREYQYYRKYAGAPQIPADAMAVFRAHHRHTEAAHA